MRYLIIINIIIICQQSFGQEPILEKEVEAKINKEIFDKLLNPSYLRDQIFEAWDSSASYYKGDLVSFRGKNYESKIESNVGTNPQGATKGEWKVTSQIPGIIIENLTINYNFDWYKLNQALKEKYKDKLDSSRRIKCNTGIIFRNCKFKSLQLRDLNIEDKLIFENCSFNLLSLNNISSKSLLMIAGSINLLELYESQIENATFENLTSTISDFGGKTTIFIGRSKLNYLGVVDPPIDLNLRIIDSQISGDSTTNKAFFIGGSIESVNKGASSFEARNSSFGNSQDSSSMELQGTFSRVMIDSCKIYSNINLYSTIVQERIHITNSAFDGNFAINNSTLPSEIKIRWKQIRGEKISKFERIEMFDSFTETFRRAERIITSGQQGVANLDHFEDIMRSYQTLLNNYKISGDIESANGCYSEMKDIQTKRLKFVYSEDKTFKTFFRWRLSQLMKFYTDHGTDPARAIVISIWVVTIFGIFYFFFPSDWDLTSKSKLIQNYKDFIERNEKGYLRPFFILTIGFILSLINALTLSLNSFTTLGFGNIPTHGIAKYFCVIEGFIGWFLLSIFTVALINQALG